MRRLCVEEPGEAARLSVLFEEMAFHDAKEAAKQEREARRSSREGSGDGSWTETSIGDDDEVDWKDASEDDDDED